VEASDDAAKKYYEETPEAERTIPGVTAVMRAAVKTKQNSFKGQFSKFTAIANPKFGNEFLDEVSVFCLHSFPFSKPNSGSLIILFFPFHRLQSTGTTMRSLR
jgi:hypothetical protein